MPSCNGYLRCSFSLWPPLRSGWSRYRDFGPGWAHLGPDAGASVQAWHWDICGAQAHQLLSLCNRQLYLNIHRKCRLMCVCLAPHGVLSNRPECETALKKKSVGVIELCVLQHEWKFITRLSVWEQGTSWWHSGLVGAKQQQNELFTIMYAVCDILVIEHINKIAFLC